VYYSALKWSSETGELPYQEWDGSLLSSVDSAYARYSFERWQKVTLKFLYPPSAVSQLSLFTLIPSFNVANVTWRFFNVCIFAGLLLMARSFIPHRRPLFYLLLFVAAYRPLRMGVWLGQVSLWIGFLLLLYVWALHHRRGFLAGIALGLGTALKIFPMLWLPLLFLYPREAKRCMAGLAAALFVNIGFATLMYGVDSWSVYYSRILSHMTLFPPLGTVSLYALLGAAQGAASGSFATFLRAFLCYILYIPAALLLIARRVQTASRKRRAVLAFTALIHLAMPLTWDHYLAFFGILVAIELLHLVPHNIKRFPLTSGLLIVVFAATGCGWLLRITGLPTIPYLTQTGLVSGLLLPVFIHIDTIYRRYRNGIRAQRSVVTWKQKSRLSY